MLISSLYDYFLKNIFSYGNKEIKFFISWVIFRNIIVIIKLWIRSLSLGWKFWIRSIYFLDDSLLWWNLRIIFKMRVLWAKNGCQRRVMDEVFLCIMSWLVCIVLSKEKCNYIFNLLAHKFVHCTLKRKTNWLMLEGHTALCLNVLIQHNAMKKNAETT